MPLPADRYLSSVEADSVAIADAARGRLGTVVPSCPEWTVEQLVSHLGAVHQWARELVSQRATERLSRRDLPPAPEGAAVVDWFATGAESLVAALREAGPDATVWNWGGGEQTAAFWFRRMAQETVVHRCDAEIATGVPGSELVVGPDLAADGIDEFLDVFLPMAFARGPIEGLEGSVHLHATDGPGEWFIGLSPTGAEVRREHTKGDVAVRGPLAQLLLLAWNRRPAEGLEVFGDATVLDRWRDRIRL